MKNSALKDNEKHTHEASVSIATLSKSANILRIICVNCNTFEILEAVILFNVLYVINIFYQQI